VGSWSGGWVTERLGDGLLAIGTSGRWGTASRPDDIALIGAVGWPAIAAGYLLAGSGLEYGHWSPVKEGEQKPGDAGAAHTHGEFKMYAFRLLISSIGKL